MNALVKRNLNRRLRARRVRMAIKGTAEKPRLSVFRSNKYTYAQLINDAKGNTIISVSTRLIKDQKTKTEKAKLLGQLLAEEAKKIGIKTVVFDRGYYQYHGRVKAVAEGAREKGLKF